MRMVWLTGVGIGLAAMAGSIDVAATSEIRAGAGGFVHQLYASAWQPEPGMLALLTSGIVGLLGVLRRRRERHERLS
jgi:hypothetical protein